MAKRILKKKNVYSFECAHNHKYETNEIMKIEWENAPHPRHAHFSCCVCVFGQFDAIVLRRYKAVKQNPYTTP